MGSLNGFYVEFVLILFVVITFLQSGIDKVLNWKENLNWLTAHFSKTIFKGMVPILLGIITILEILSALLASYGLFEFFYKGSKLFAFYGALTASLTLLMLLLGQRIAKEYEGAKTIVVYLIPTMFLLYLLQP
jgi:hypothetical protein